MPEIDPQLRRDNRREGGFAKSRRAVQQHVIQRLTAQLGRIDEHRQVFLDLLLSYVFL